MRFQLDKESRTPIYDQIREQLISALHVGRVSEGTKLPSVRHFARVHGVNPKTIHRIYRRLHEEGYVRLRPGSGAYVAPVQRGDLNGDRLLSLHRFVRSALQEFGRMGVDSGRAVELFESFVSRDGIGTCRIGVVECTEELVAVFTREIRADLGVQVVPTPLETLRSAGGLAFRNLSFFVTTDFHLDEVSEIARGFGKSALQLKLNRSFVPSLMAAAERGTLVMILSSTAGSDAFRRAMAAQGLGSRALERIRIVSAGDPAAVRLGAAEADTIYVSPLVADRIGRLVPPGKQVLQFERHLARESMDLMEAAILFATEERATP